MYKRQEHDVQGSLENVNQQKNHTTNKHENMSSESNDGSSAGKSLRHVTGGRQSKTKLNSDKKHTNFEFFNYDKPTTSSQGNSNESAQRASNHRYESDLSLDTVTPFAFTMLGDFKKFKEVQLGTSPLNPFRSEESFEDPLDTTEPTRCV